MNKSRSKLRKLTIQIADEFLKNGYFEHAAGGVNPATSQISAGQNDFRNFDSLWGGFAGLSVQGNCLFCFNLFCHYSVDWSFDGRRPFAERSRRR